MTFLCEEWCRKHEPRCCRYEIGSVRPTVDLSVVWSAPVSATSRQHNGVYPDYGDRDQHREPFEDGEVPHWFDVLKILQLGREQTVCYLQECHDQEGVFLHDLLTWDKPMTKISIGKPISTQFPSCTASDRLVNIKSKSVRDHCKKLASVCTYRGESSLKQP